MKYDTVVLPALTGTFFMTLFSNMASVVVGKDLSEPHLLSVMEKEFLPGKMKRLANPSAQILHYSIGISITALYHCWCKKYNKNPTLLNGFMMGGLSGLAGIAIWKAVFVLHPAPPNIPERKFFNQLLLAHLVFGIGVAQSKRWLNQNRDKVYHAVQKP